MRRRTPRLTDRIDMWLSNAADRVFCIRYYTLRDNILSAAIGVLIGLAIIAIKVKFY